MGHPEITIAICAYNRSDALERCLGVLARQTCATTRFEVLVVGNASADDTPTVARWFSNSRCSNIPRSRFRASRGRAIEPCQSAKAKSWASRHLCRFLLVALYAGSAARRGPACSVAARTRTIDCRYGSRRLSSSCGWSARDEQASTNGSLGAGFVDASSPLGTYRRGQGLSGISCAGLAVEHIQAAAFEKRSPNITANWALATHRSRAGIVHSFSERFKTRKSSFMAASSVGKWPLARTARRNFAFRASMASCRSACARPWGKRRTG